MPSVDFVATQGQGDRVEGNPNPNAGSFQVEIARQAARTAVDGFVEIELQRLLPKPARIPICVPFTCATSKCVVLVAFVWRFRSVQRVEQLPAAQKKRLQGGHKSPVRETKHQLENDFLRGKQGHKRHDDP